MGGRLKAADSVKNAPRLSAPRAGTGNAQKPKQAAIFNADAGSALAPPKPANSNCRLPRGPGRTPEHRHITQSGVIPRGPLTGQPKRRPTNRTKSIAFDQVRNVVNAIIYAEKIGHPLNNGITAAWEWTDLYDGTPAGWAHCQTKFQDLLKRWLARKGIKTELVYVRERAKARGAHTHFQFYAPPRLRKPLFDYLNATLKFRPDGLCLDDTDFGMQTPVMRAGNLRYHLKGIDHAATTYRGLDTINIGAALGIDHRGQQGTVEIKRCGCSHGIDKTARKRAGWQELRDLEALYRALNPPKAGEQRKAA